MQKKGAHKKEIIFWRLCEGKEVIKKKRVIWRRN
jgi:hypothetical protein